MEEINQEKVIKELIEKINRLEEKQKEMATKEMITVPVGKLDNKLTEIVYSLVGVVACLGMVEVKEVDEGVFNKSLLAASKMLPMKLLDSLSYFYSGKD